MSWQSWIGQKIGLYGERAQRAWAHYVGGGKHGAVTPRSAMMLSAFWRGVHLTAETCATLPPGTYLDTEEGGVIDRNNPYDVLARVSPNRYQTRVEFWEGMFGALEVVGNGYAKINFLGGRPVSFTPLDPDPAVTMPFRNSQKELRYRGSDWNGNRFPDLAPEEVFHLKGFNFGGDEGLSTVTYGAHSLGMIQAANKAARNTFEAGLSGSGFLETGQVLDEPDRVRLNEIMKKYQDDDAPGKMMILEGGMKWNKLSLSAVDAQLLETMGFGIEEIARWLGMPPILLGHSSAGQTMWGTGVESIIQSWYVLGLRSRLTRAETAWQKRVIQPKDQGKFYLKFNVGGLLRGDTQTQALIAATLAQNGLRSRDELRRLDDLGPIPGGGGKLFTAQTNLGPLESLGQNSGDQGGGGDPVARAIRNMIAEALAGRGLEDMIRANQNRLLPPPGE